MTRACGFFKRWLTIWKRERGRRKERGDFRQWSKKEGETARPREAERMDVSRLGWQAKQGARGTGKEKKKKKK